MLKGCGCASGTWLITGPPTATSKQRLTIQKMTNPYTGHINQKNGFTITKFISALNVILSGCIKYIVVVIATNPRIVIKSICMNIVKNLLVRASNWLLEETETEGVGESISIINELFLGASTPPSPSSATEWREPSLIGALQRGQWIIFSASNTFSQHSLQMNAFVGQHFLVIYFKSKSNSSKQI
jgi:hypothetical protein